MRSLKQYIVESVRTYNYTIKIAGEVDKNWVDLFKHNLKKFDPVQVGDAKTTPIQKEPYGFPGASNQPVTIIRAEFRYPASEPMIQQIAQLIGGNVNMVRVSSTDYEDGLATEAEAFENQVEASPLLSQHQMGEQPGAKEAAKAYSSSYLDSIQTQAKDTKNEIQFSGKKTSTSFDPFKPQEYVDKAGLKSPLTTTKRPEKPKAGNSK